MKYIDGDKIVPMTPQVMAHWFATQDERKQAEFLNTVADEVKGWGYWVASGQWLAISQSEVITDGARKLLKHMVEYIGEPE